MLGVTQRRRLGPGPGSASARGATLVEYALLLALIAAICMGAISMLGGSTSAKLSVLGTQLERPGVTAPAPADGNQQEGGGSGEGGH